MAVWFWRIVDRLGFWLCLLAAPHIPDDVPPCLRTGDDIMRAIAFRMAVEYVDADEEQRLAAEDARRAADADAAALTFYPLDD